MALTGTYQIASIPFHFSNYADSSLMNTWQWKLDSFRSTGIPDNIPAVTICNQTVSESFPLSERSSAFLKEIHGFFSHQLFKTVDGDIIWKYIRNKESTPILSYLLKQDWSSISLLEDFSSTNGAMAFEYLTQFIPGLALKHNMLTFHAVLVEYENEAFAVAADSGVGKTTHARLWRDYFRAFILNGDRAVCQRTENGWIGHGIPWCGTSGEYMNRSTPLKAFVILERSEQNRVEKLDSMGAFSALFPHILCPSWDESLVQTAMSEFEFLIEQIPIYRLSCRPDRESAELLKQALFQGD